MRKMLGGVQDYSESQSKKKNKNKNNRRFSDEQIKSLESLFKVENKLEPRKKLEMARELGLHPRQVAIWFQNRRARWKSKQVEQEYRTLKADYDSLSHRFESLKKEKHALLTQLGNLCSKLKEPCERSDEDLGGNGTDSGELEHNVDEKEGEDLMKMGDDEQVDNQTVNSFDLACLFDQSCGDGSNWWDFWP